MDSSITKDPLAEQHASWARGIALLLGEGWECNAHQVTSDRVRIDLPTREVKFRSNRERGGWSSVVVSDDATLGTYATLGQALHNMTDDAARVELEILANALRSASHQLDAWARRHNRP